MRSGSFSTEDVCRITGLSYRQLDYWTRTGLVRPSLHDGRGSGAPYRRWSGSDVDEVLLIAKLVRAGVSYGRIRDDRDPRKTAKAVAEAMGRVLEEVAS